MATVPTGYCAFAGGVSTTVYPGPPVPVPAGSPPWITNPGTIRWNVDPLNRPWFVRNTMLLTVFGATPGSSSIWIAPHDVSRVHRYFFFVSMLIAGGFEYLLLNRDTVAASEGVVPPQATLPAGGVVFLEPPPRVRAATTPPTATSRAMTRPMAIIRFRDWRLRSA